MSDVIALVQALAWPLTVVWLSYAFRAELRRLLLRMSRLKYKDLEATFDQDLKLAEAKADTIEMKSAPPAMPAPEVATQLDQLQRIARVSPRAAILEAWLLVEAAAGQSGFVQGAAVPRVNAYLFVDALVKDGKLPPESLELIQTMRQLRNQAAHMLDLDLSYEEAERYLRLASKLSTLIERPV